MTNVIRLPTDDRGPFAMPRPAMRGRYAIQNPIKAVLMRLLDAFLSLIPVKRSPPPAHPHEILLAHWAHLGDVTTALGMIRYLREQFPGAQIGMIVGSLGARAIQDTGLVDRLHIIDHWKLSRARGGFVSRYRQYRSMRAQALKEMKAVGYQVAIDCYFRFPAAHPLFWAAKIPSRVGFSSTGWGPLLTHQAAWPNRSAPIADHYRALIRAAWPVMDPTSEDARPKLSREVVDILPAAVAGCGDYLIVHPGAGAPFKDWGSDNWLALLGVLRQDPQLSRYHVVITGAGAQEVEYAAILADEFPCVINMAGQAKWGEFLAIVANARIVICPDTVTAHVAAALDVPVISLFTGTNNPFQWGPDSDQGVVLTQDVLCAPCHRGCKRMACIRDIRPADVAAHVVRYL